MSDQRMIDEAQRELLLEEIELALRSLELDYALAVQGQKARRAMILGDAEAYEQMADARVETAARIRDLNADIRGYNARARAHVGGSADPGGPDISEGAQRFLDAMGLGPNTTVIRVSLGSFPFGGFNPTDAPVASWGDENLGGFTAGGVRYGSGSADGPE